MKKLKNRNILSQQQNNLIINIIIQVMKQWLQIQNDLQQILYQYLVGAKETLERQSC